VAVLMATLDEASAFLLTRLQTSLGSSFDVPPSAIPLNTSQERSWPSPRLRDTEDQCASAPHVFSTSSSRLG